MGLQEQAGAHTLQALVTAGACRLGTGTPRAESRCQVKRRLQPGPNLRAETGIELVRQGSGAPGAREAP